MKDAPDLSPTRHVLNEVGYAELVKEFDTAMLGIYQRALSEANYPARSFLDMLFEHGGLETARLLIHKGVPSEGYTRLWELGRLDLSVEALIYENSKWHPLFTAEDLTACMQRLKDYRYL